MDNNKVDLVMWIKNGAKTLPYVLSRIGFVIPKSVVRRKIIIDDHSVDNSKFIASRFGWSVYPNNGKGISDGANTALKYIECKRFVSLEQDILLSQDWWSKVPELLAEKNTAVASGTRVPNQPLAMRKLSEFNIQTYPRELEDSDAFHLGKTLDNTIYQTEIIKSIGGFPRTFDACVDNVLAKRIYDSGLKWKVAYNTKSLHIRKGLRDELHHFFWYGAQYPFLEPYVLGRHSSAQAFLKRLIVSPKYGMDLALKLKAPQLIYIYPLIRAALYRGFISGRRNMNIR